MRKRLIAILACVIVLTAWAVRFAYLNLHTPLAKKIYYSMGETVSYGDDFFYAADENRNGYSIVVKKATLYPYQEYADKMHVTLPEIGENMFRADYVYDLEATIINKGNEEGGIDMFNTCLVHSNFRMPLDLSLWDLLYPQLGGSYTFKLRPNTQMDFHFPFAVETAFEQKKIDLKYLQTKPFVLNLSSYPNNKMIRIELD